MNKIDIMTREEYKANLELLVRMKESDRELKQAGESLLVEKDHPQSQYYLELETAFIKMMDMFTNELIYGMKPVEWLLNMANTQEVADWAVDMVMRRYDNCHTR